MKSILTTAIIISLAFEMGLTINLEDSNKDFRILQTWNSYSECSSCQTDVNCSFLNGVWQSNPGTSTFYINYQQNTEFQYWFNAVPSGEIDWRNKGNMTLYMTAKSTASASYHPIWEWRIQTNSTANIAIEISRSKMNYEDLLMYISNINTFRTYSSKEISSWSSSSTKFYFTGVSYVILRSKMLSDLSNYQINITQTFSSSVLESRAYTTTEDSYTKIIGITIGAVLFIFFWALITFVIHKSIKF